MLRIVDNPDKELRDIAESALRTMKEKYGKRYCPCGLEQVQSMVCPCDDFRLQKTEGECNCGRYKKVLTN